MSGTFERRDQVTREREHRERLGLWIGSDENQGVRTARQLCLTSLSAVGADHECRGRLPGNRHVEVLRRRDVDLRLRADRRDELMRLEVRSACDPAGHDDRDEGGPEHDGPNDAPGVPTWTLGLPVTLHRGLNAGRVHRATVAVHGGTASHASLQRRLHAALKQDGARFRGRQPLTRIAEVPAGPGLEPSPRRAEAPATSCARRYRGAAAGVRFSYPRLGASQRSASSMLMPFRAA